MAEEGNGKKDWRSRRMTRAETQKLFNGHPLGAHGLE
jgi:hypothetical protein